MKKLLQVLILFFILCFSFFIQAQPKLKIYIVSHNEDNIGYLNGIGGYNRYLKSRSALISLCDMVQSKKLAYDYGADYIALQAIAKFDTGSVITLTNNKNLVKWMKEDKGIECDPHAHESAYNYADVAYLMSQLGITPTNVMSGFLYDTVLLNGVSWEKYQNGVTGDSFPNFTWYPEILWGAANLQHFDDPQYSGVYKPKSMAEFTVHEPSNNLILCGTGCELKLEDTTTVAAKFAQIKKLVNDIQNGTLPANGIYTQEIFFSEGDMTYTWFYPLIDQLTDSINTLVKEGKVEWETISDIVTEWKANGENAFAIDCSYNPILPSVTDIKENNQTKNLPLIYPNPGNGLLYFNNLQSGLNHLRIYNQVGQCIFRKEIFSEYKYIDCSFLPEGIYYFQLNENAQKYILIQK